MGRVSAFWTPLRTLLVAALLIAGLPGPQVSNPSVQAQEIDADALPIVDLHFHPDADWDVDALVQLFDQLGVARGKRRRRTR